MAVLFVVAFVLSYLAAFCKPGCIYKVYLKNVGSPDLGWTLNSLNMRINYEVILYQFQGQESDVQVTASDVIEFNYNKDYSNVAYKDYVEVILNEKTILNTLPEVSFVPNQCAENPPCMYEVKTESDQNEPDSWNADNEGYIYVNGKMVLELDSADNRIFYVSPEDIIELYRPYKYGIGMRAGVGPYGAPGNFYFLTNEGFGPQLPGERNPVFNFCLTPDWSLLFKTLPEIITPQVQFRVSVVLPVGTSQPEYPIDVKVIFKCTGGGGTLWSFFISSVPNFNTSFWIYPGSTSYGTCEVYVSSQIRGVNPFLPSAKQIIELKYLLTFSSHPLVVSMLEPISITITAPNSQYLTSADVELSCDGGWAQKWTNVDLNVSVDLTIASPVPPSSQCRLYTALDPELAINAEALVITPFGPFPLIPASENQLKEFTSQIYIPSSELF